MYRLTTEKQKECLDALKKYTFVFDGLNKDAILAKAMENAYYEKDHVSTFIESVRMYTEQCDEKQFAWLRQLLAGSRWTFRADTHRILREAESVLGTSILDVPSNAGFHRP